MATETKAPSMTEEVWQAQLLDLAHFLGWKHMHVRRSIGKGRQWTTATNVKGWPDLTLWNGKQQRVLFVELKSAAGVVSSDQTRVLASLRAAGAEVAVWYPDDLLEAHAVLAGRSRLVSI